MRALIREGRLKLASRPTPALAPDEVLVEVAFAGLCRTDIQAADGILRVREPRILGHEFSGTVAAVGAAAERDFRIKQRVAVMPLLPCGRCFGCAHQRPCAHPGLLGVDRDGAFAERVAVPMSAVYPIPKELPLHVAAFAEPVAAAMAALEADLDPSERGAIYGRGRIAELTLRVLRWAGFEGVEIVDPEDALGEDVYDFIVETRLDAAAWPRLVAATRPQGRLVLKSRVTGPLLIDPLPAIHKHLTLAAVYYGDFRGALGMLSAGLEVEDLLGAPQPLEAYAEVFEEARRGEAIKPLFRLTR